MAKQFHELIYSAADFAADDFIAVDGATNKTRKMSKDDLLAKTAQNALGSIKNLPTSITAFRTDDVIPVDGPSGTAKMSKDDLLKETAQNALAGNVAPAFDQTKPNDADGFAYYAGEEVMYNGEKYTFIFNKPTGSWISSYAYKSSLLETKKSWAILIGSRYYKVVKIDKWLWVAENLDEVIGTEGTDYVNYSDNDAPFFGKYYKWSTLCKSDGSNSDALDSLLGSNTHFHVPDSDDIYRISPLYLKDSSVPSYLWRSSSEQNNSNGLSLVPSYRDGSYSSSGQYQLWTSISESESNATRIYGGFSFSTKLNLSSSAAKTTKLPVRLCCKMNTSTDDPRDYGCVDYVYNQQLPILPKEGSFSLVVKNGMIAAESFQDSLPIGKQTSKLPTINLITTKKYYYSDGTQPKVDWYLFCDYKTLKFYSTRDLKNFEYLFTWSGTRSPWDYSWAIRENNDLIAIMRADIKYSGSASLDDTQKENPSVFLYSENYQTRHIVDFGDSLKPAGWLSNCGFLNLPNGDSIFCEYSRPNVKTTNVWKIAASANILEKASYVNKLTYDISGDLSVGIKHFHCIQYDPFSGIVYAARGDDNVGAMVFYSDDSGDTWNDAYGGGSEKYCRLLNFIFTKDYIYWAADSSLSANHYLFRASRDADGLIDYSSVDELAHIVDGTATYGISYLPLLNAFILNERTDAYAASIKVYIYDINSATLSELCEMDSYSGESIAGLGFRTEYTEFNPSGNTIVYGFSKRDRINLFKGFGNLGASPNTVGTLCMTVGYDGTSFTVTFDTVYC